MDDQAIIALYHARDERAIAETDAKYGVFCRTLARNILTQPLDAEECVNDTWLRAWNAMPPERPARLKSWLGRIVRNLSLDRWRHSRAAKRGAGLDILLSELEDCVPVGETPEAAVEAAELGESISRWLRTRSADDRGLFLRRYWYGEGVQTLAVQAGISPQRVSKRLCTMRQALKAHLEQEGFCI